MGLRERNRNRAMRELQLIALDRFEADGFDAVTVDDIAAEGGVSASTIYRYFGTKERLVVWDGNDQAITDDLVLRLATTPPMTAFRDTLVAAFSDEQSNQPLLRRVQFIYSNRQVHAAAIEQDLEDQAELAEGFAHFAGRKTPTIEDNTRAGVCMAALDAAIGEWQRQGNESSLATLITQAFDSIQA